MSSILDRTAGTLTTLNGEIVTRPATIIGADAAAILRNYFHWILKQQLEPELFCRSCYNGTKDSKAIYNITAEEIQIVCACQIRYFKGTWLTPEPVTPNTSAKDDTIGLQQVTLSTSAARLLRLYKRVLQDLGLMEALRCNICHKFDPSQDGCEAQVRAMNIRIRCRCSDRTFTGMSV